MDGGAVSVRDLEPGASARNPRRLASRPIGVSEAVDLDLSGGFHPVENNAILVAKATVTFAVEGGKAAMAGCRLAYGTTAQAVGPAAAG